MNLVIAPPANAARISLTVIALVLELAHLGWTYFHGGVPSHHLLNRADLPAISNWWGAAVIPALTWFLVGRIQLRFSRSDRLAPVVAGFLCALAYGASLALAFTMQSAAVTYLFLGLFAISVLVPTYRAEYVLGFVIGMSVTFGAVLPTAVACVVALFSGLVRFLFIRIKRLVQNRRAPFSAPG